MVHFDRILTAFHHQDPDRTPYFEYCLYSERVTEIILGRPFALLAWDDCLREKGWAGTIRQIAKDYLDIAEFFDHDLIYVPNNAAPARSSEPVTQTVEAEDDPVAKVAANNARRLQAIDPFMEESFLIYEILQDEMRKRGIALPILAPAYLHGVWTNTDLMQTMLLEPEVAKKHFEIATLRAERLIDKYLELGIEFIGIGGDFAGNTPLISPECYRTFIMPELRKLSDRIHRGRKFVINASDGNLWSVIDDFLIESGVDGYLEIDQHAGMELKKLKENFGDRVTFLGNMDCGNTLSFASPEEIRRATIQCIESGLGGGGHVFTASNAITASISVKNYFAMVNAYRDYWKLPVLKIS